MKLHFCTQDKAEYSFEYSLNIMSDDEYNSLIQEKEIDDILNSDEVLDLISNSDLDAIIEVIDSLFDKTSNGMFDWNDKCVEYYDLFDKSLQKLCCRLENEAGDFIKEYNCKLSDGYYIFSDKNLSVSLTNFNSGNGEPIGAQLALEMVELFMNTGQWHVGLIDSKNNLITNISAWAKDHILDIESIKPIVWFGRQEEFSECWSITPDTRDLFVNQFWGDYYEGALPYICKADEGLGIYYSVWEYDLDYDPSIFEDIKSSCPIDLSLNNEDRANALYNLVISIYNDNKADEFPSVERDVYARGVIECDIIVKNDNLGYSYSKPYKFQSIKLGQLDKNLIDDILWEDEAYRNSFYYLKDFIIEKCDLSSYNEIWKTVKSAISILENKLNSNLLCQIQKEGNVLTTIPFSVALCHNNFPICEIEDVVFIKSLIAFFKRGRWHIGYREASQLPPIYTAMGKKIEQKGTYPVVWFNDSDEIIGKMAIWPAQEQYTLSLTWKDAADFCSRAFNKNDVHNNYKNNGSILYEELETEFERIKAECPIHIKNEKEPVDYEELVRVVSDSDNH